jgi:rhodanese-related sulfurtransferase
MYCGSGGRSRVGRRMLRQMGYKNVYNLGGYRRAAHILRGSV